MERFDEARRLEGAHERAEVFVAGGDIDHIGLSKASLSKIVARLEGQDLVKRGAAAGDRRRHTLNLTAHGQRTLDQAERATLRSIAGRLTHLHREELAVIVRALDLLEVPFSAGS